MIKTDQRDVRRFQLYFTSLKEEILAPEVSNYQVHVSGIRDKNIARGKNNILEMPEWMKVGQKVIVKKYHSRKKNGKDKIMTIRTIEWPFLVTFEENPIGGCNPRRILGPVSENEPLDSESET